jgi:hypothetical protein
LDDEADGVATAAFAPAFVAAIVLTVTGWADRRNRSSVVDLAS